MAERKFPLEPYGVAYDCDECGKEMKPTAEKVAWLTLPVKFPHECVNGHAAALAERYPIVRWRHPALTGEDTAGSPTSQNTEPGLAFSDAGER